MPNKAQQEYNKIHQIKYKERKLKDLESLVFLHSMIICKDEEEYVEKIFNRHGSIDPILNLKNEIDIFKQKFTGEEKNKSETSITRKARELLLSFIDSLEESISEYIKLSGNNNYNIRWLAYKKITDIVQNIETILNNIYQREKVTTEKLRKEFTSNNNNENKAEDDNTADNKALGQTSSINTVIDINESTPLIPNKGPETQHGFNLFNFVKNIWFSQKLQFDNFSDESLLKIMWYLPIADLLSLAKVNKRFNNLSKDKSLWGDVVIKQLLLKLTSIYYWVPRNIDEFIQNGVFIEQLRKNSNNFKTAFIETHRLANLEYINQYNNETRESFTAFLEKLTSDPKILREKMILANNYEWLINKNGVTINKINQLKMQKNQILPPTTTFGKKNDSIIKIGLFIFGLIFTYLAIMGFAFNRITDDSIINQGMGAFFTFLAVILNLLVFEKQIQGCLYNRQRDRTAKEINFYTNKKKIIESKMNLLQPHFFPVGETIDKNNPTSTGLKSEVALAL